MPSMKMRTAVPAILLISNTCASLQPYYSPQLLSYQPYDPLAADIWALGVTIFAMTNGKFLYRDWTAEKMLPQQTNPEYLISSYSTQISRQMHNLLKRMLEPDEMKRFTIDKVLDHTWILRKGRFSESERLR